MNIPIAKPPITEGKKRLLINEGVFQARIVQIIDLGTVVFNWNGEEKFDRTFAFRFETPTEFAVFNEEKGEQPFLMTDNVKFKITKQESEMKSKLDNIIIATGSKPNTNYNVFDLLDKTLLIDVKHKESKGKMYANITNYMALPKGMPVEDRINDLKALYLTPEYFDQEMFESLGQYTQEKIKASPEYQQIMGQLPDNQSNAIRAELPAIDINEIDELTAPF